MKRSARAESSNRKQQNAKRVEELEQEKKSLQKEVDELRHKFANMSVPSDGGAQNLEDGYLEKLNKLEAQVLELRKKLETQSQLLKQKQASDEAAKRLQVEIWRIRSQKAQLQRKIKEDSVQFRSWKALQQKEVLQLKKEGRRTNYGMQKLFALNQRQKMVLLRKTKEASMATKWLKELLASRKASSCGSNANDSRLQAIEQRVEITERLNKVRFECERQMEERVRMAEEAAKFKEEADVLMQKNLLDMLQDKEADCKEKDLEIRDLREEVAKLNGLVGQLNIKNEEFMNTENSEGPGRSLMLESLVSNAESLEGMFTSELEHSGMDTSNNDWTDSGKRSAERLNSQDIDFSSGEEIFAAPGKTVSEACCSCSKKSSCKTMKCKCRASGGFCSTSCGCALKKCANREACLVKELNSSQHSEMADSSVRNSSGNAETERTGIQASHGAALLQGASLEKPADMNADHGTRPKPLSDIGNIKVKPCRRKKKQNH
ncbi:kinesin-like protein KIN-4C [Malania oleifera]|uniref:kinesin-like protein KIN-4C n=1 Tax=Malania oleifera TaxID=397392 RepID=UPI0025AE302F|nr:kinesin-like protein KIN-4C [Malania oleifera]